jgi:hypothetical protein
MDAAKEQQQPKAEEEKKKQHHKKKHHHHHKKHHTTKAEAEVQVPVKRKHEEIEEKKPAAADEDDLFVKSEEEDEVVVQPEEEKKKAKVPKKKKHHTKKVETEDEEEEEEEKKKKHCKRSKMTDTEAIAEEARKLERDAKKFGKNANHPLNEVKELMGSERNSKTRACKQEATERISTYLQVDEAMKRNHTLLITDHIAVVLEKAAKVLAGPFAVGRTAEDVKAAFGRLVALSVVRPDVTEASCYLLERSSDESVLERVKAMLPNSDWRSVETALKELKPLAENPKKLDLTGFKASSQITTLVTDFELISGKEEFVSRLKDICPEFDPEPWLDTLYDSPAIQYKFNAPRKELLDTMSDMLKQCNLIRHKYGSKQISAAYCIERASNAPTNTNRQKPSAGDVVCEFTGQLIEKDKPVHVVTFVYLDKMDHEVTRPFTVSAKGKEMLLNLYTFWNWPREILKMTTTQYNNMRPARASSTDKRDAKTDNSDILQLEKYVAYAWQPHNDGLSVAKKLLEAAAEVAKETVTAQEPPRKKPRVAAAAPPLTEETIQVPDEIMTEPASILYDENPPPASQPM